MKTHFSVGKCAAIISHCCGITYTFFNSSASLCYVQLQIFGLEMLVNAVMGTSFAPTTVQRVWN